ncbi:MAG: Ferritin Dps family protein [Gammaproteobacteria bacterium]|jgi:starvation-inducible DNA-binding protein|nr:Ferritin Dps family protein [Gammaproteobacteria bacterium]
MKHKFTEKHDFMAVTGSNKVINLLNQSLANAIALKLQAKQAHWNVKGPNFIALHELFDKVSGEVDGYADMLAERAVQLGGLAEGTLQHIGAANSLDLYPADTQDEQEHIKALSRSIFKFADGTRQLIKQAAEANDDVTADVCTEVTRGMDMLYWFVSAHLAT